MKPGKSRAEQQPSSAGQTSLHFGKVTELDTTQYHCRVRIDELGGLISYWLPSQNPLPAVGELVAVLLQNEGSGGLVMPLAKSKADRHKITYADDTVDEYAEGEYRHEGADQYTVSADRIDLNP